MLVVFAVKKLEQRLAARNRLTLHPLFERLFLARFYPNRKRKGKRGHPRT